MKQTSSDKIRQNWWRWKWWAVPSLGLALLIGWLAWRSPTPTVPDQHLVSQKGREFLPGTLSIKRGDVVHIVNDDEDLSHHAYVASDSFKFDSGDQGPGHNVDILFTEAGTFNVLCSIHPRMRLRVQVQQR